MPAKDNWVCIVFPPRSGIITWFGCESQLQSQSIRAYEN